MSKRTWIILIILIVGVFGFFIISSKKESGEKVDGNASINGDPKEIVSTDHQRGSTTKKVVLIEYLDLQCPGCGQLNPSMQEIMKDYNDTVTFVHRVFPLSDIHRNAVAGARAVEAAANQGKFFEMEDKLFENQSSWESLSTAKAQTVFEDYAKELGLNTDTFKKDFASAETLDKINVSRTKGDKMGVTGTPTIFINGEKITFQSPSDIRTKLDDAIKNAK